MWKDAVRGMETRASRAPRTIRAELLDGREHYDVLVADVVASAKVSVWIATANLKTMLVEGTRGKYVSFFARLAELAAKGVDVCILHASAPSGPLATELTRLGARAKAVKLRRCPRVHLKLVAVDGRHLYLGSANVTGAGLGAKGDGRRNFEMGVLTDDPGMLDAAQERFDRIWRGAECASCALREQCPSPLDGKRAARSASTARGGARRRSKGA